MNEKQFATLPTNKVFLKCVIPGMLSLLFSSLYSIADGMIVGRFIGSDALAAVNLVFPILMIAYAVGDMIAVGSNVKISIALGQNDEHFANKLFTSGLLLMFIINIVMAILGFIFAKTFIFTIIDEPGLAQNVYDYTKIFLLFLPTGASLFAVDNYLRSCGKAKFSMWVNIIVSVINIGLDFILVAILGFGIEAAALTSGLSMSVGTFICLIPFIRKQLTLKFASPFIPLKDLWGMIYNGSSEFFNKIAGSIIGILTNTLLLQLGGSLSIAAYGIVMYIDGLLMCMMFGILDALQPPVSYNLGRGNIKKLFEFFRLTCILGGAISLILMCIMFIYPEFLASIFAQENDVAVISQTKQALLLFAPSYLFTWFNMIVGSFLTSFDRPKESLLLMSARSIVIPLVSLIILPLFMGVNGVFLTPTVTNGITFIISLYLWYRVSQQMQATETSSESSTSL